MLTLKTGRIYCFSCSALLTFLVPSGLLILRNSLLNASKRQKTLKSSFSSPPWAAPRAPALTTSPFPPRKPTEHFSTRTQSCRLPHAHQWRHQVEGRTRAEKQLQIDTRDPQLPSTMHPARLISEKEPTRSKLLKSNEGPQCQYSPNKTKTQGTRSAWRR